MASKYDKIKTAKDLVTEVMMHGLSTVQEDICRAQDIFGHSTIEELANLAKDIGRNDENGNPDPKGTWSSGRRGTCSAFYQIAFSIWNWEDAVRFWNQHSNPEHDELADSRKKLQAMAKELEKAGETMEKYWEREAQNDKILSERLNKITELSAKVYEQEREIIRLKARLFDMMEKGGC